MFIDYLTLMLINMSAGLLILALFVFRFMDKDSKKVAPGLLVSGFVALVTGLHEIFTWPIPGSYNIPFGEGSVLFGALLLGTGIAVLRDWDLLTLCIYSVFAGAASIVLGARIWSLQMTNAPLLSTGGFILTGLAAVLALPAYYLRRFLVVRILGALALLGAAAIWAATGYLAYWAHLQNFSKWTPPIMPPAK
jgi:putative membrane protein